MWSERSEQSHARSSWSEWSERSYFCLIIPVIPVRLHTGLAYNVKRAERAKLLVLVISVVGSYDCTVDMHPEGWELWNKFRQFTEVNPHLFPWIYYMNGIYQYFIQITVSVHLCVCHRSDALPRYCFRVQWILMSSYLAGCGVLCTDFWWG